MSGETSMTDLLIRDIDPDLMLLIEQRARTHNQNVSEEAKALIRAGLSASEHNRKMGTWMRSLVPPEDRGDDLVFEHRGPGSPPPDFD
jgi:plasmid stability protein